MRDPDPHGYQAIIQSWPPSHDCRGLTEIALARPTRIVVASDAASARLRDSVLDELRRDL